MKALLIVDVQNDFVEGGSLGVDGGKNVAAKIEKYLSEHQNNYKVIYASRDAHLPDSDNGGHFSDTPDYTDTWPAHCVQGTEGFNYAFNKNDSIVDIYKGQGTPSYSAFEGTDESHIPFETLLKDSGITELDVCGIATDYCVKASVLDAVKAGLKVKVLEDLCAGVNPETTKQALVEMARVTNNGKN